MPGWVIVNGPRRTGSTLVYNIARLILLEVGGVAHGVLPAESAADLVKSEPKPSIVKVHNWFASYPHTEVSYVHLFTWRDPADTLASHLAFPETRDLDAALDEIRDGARAYVEAQRRRDTRLIHYENLFAHLEGGIYAIGTMLGFDVSPALAEKICAAVDPAATRAYTMLLKDGNPDPWTELRYAHVSDTLGHPGRGKTLTPEQKRRLAMAVEAA